MLIEPIGYLRSCYPDRFGTPRQSGLVTQAQGMLEIFPHLQPEFALEGLSGFSHLWLIFGFHRNTNALYRPKVHPPRLGGESIGVFATRSPHRPNPLGLSLVKLERVEAPRIFLSGVDLIDGTPIYDIKPYLPALESRSEARAGWVEEAPEKEIQFEWPDECLEALSVWEKEAGRRDLRPLIEETLRLDPRPLVYRGYEGRADGPYRGEHAVRFYEGDVHFSFVSPERVRITKVEAPFRLPEPPSA